MKHSQTCGEKESKVYRVNSADEVLPDSLSICPLT